MPRPFVDRWLPFFEALVQLSPRGDSPTAEALARARDYFGAEPGSETPGRDYVLLLTDGLANCNSGAPEDTLAQVDELRDASVSTVVVGLPGSEPNAEWLGQLAEAGGYAEERGMTTHYAPSAAGGVSELTDTLRRIAMDLAEPCEVPLREEVPEPTNIDVAVDCEVVPRGSSDGDVNVSQWYFDRDPPREAEHIVLAGPICARVSSEPPARIDVVYGCGEGGIF